MRILLYPFIEIIWLSSTVFKVFRSSPELAAVLSGLLASSLIGTVYIGLPSAVLLSRVKRLRGVRSGRLVLRILSFSLLGGFGALATGELIANVSLTIFSTTVIILSSMLLSGIITARKITMVLSK